MLLGVQLAFASWAIVGKVTIGVVPPFALTLLRLAGGAVVFGAIGRVQGRPLLPPRGERGEFVGLALSGLVINQLCFTAGLARTSAIETALLVALIPVCAATYGVLTGRERPSRGFWLGLLCATAGAVCVARPGRLGQGPPHLLGDLLVLVNSASYAVYLVRGRGVFARHGAVAVLGWIFPIAALLVAPLGLPALCGSAPSWSARSWAAIAYVIAAPTVLAYGGNAYALARAPSSLVAAFIYVQPALAVLLAVTIGDPLARWLAVRPPGERLDALASVGLLAILAGVWLATRPARAKGAKA